MPHTNPAMNTAEIEFVHVSKFFDSNVVLQDLSFTIHSGESFALIGKSGEGKSVALKIMLGLLKCDGGKVLVGGGNLVDGIDEFRRSIGVLFQGGALFDSLPVWKNVAFAGLKGIHRTGKTSARKAAEETLERVGLDADICDLYPAELSGGMNRRVGIARALYGQPRLLFFDEPTTGLDPVRSSQITDLIGNILSDGGVTAVTVSHDMAFVSKIADRVALLDGGRIVWRGNSDEIATAEDGRLGNFVQGRS